MLERVLTPLLVFAASCFAVNPPRFAYGFPDIDVGATAVVVDSSGNTYVTGSVEGNPFTATPGAYQSHNAGTACIDGPIVIGGPSIGLCRNAFVVKLDPAGAVVFATYLGGSGDALSSAIAVDAQGNIYIAGTTSAAIEQDSSLFPVTPGAAFAKGESFVAKLNASGTQLVYSTSIPGALLSSIAVDSAGDVYFNGGWNSSIELYPATPGAYQTAPQSSVSAAIVGKLNPSGSELIYGTYLPGTGVGIAVDAGGNALITATSNGAEGLVGNDVYLARLNSDGSELLISMVLGPVNVSTMKVGPGGDIYLGCYSAASNFPAAGAGFGVAPPSSGYFLVHVSPDGSSVMNSVYLPFILSSAGGALDVDSAGNAYVVGYGTVETTAGAFQSAPVSGTSGTLVAKITPDGQVAGVTYFGNYSGNYSLNVAGSIAAERDGSVVVAGNQNSVTYLGGAPPSPEENVFVVANFFPAITVENAASYVANAVVPENSCPFKATGSGL